MSKSPLEQLMGLLDNEGAAALMLAASRRLGEQLDLPDHVVSEGQAHGIPDRAVIPFIIPQWTDADGKTYGVEVIPLELRDRIEAERWATDEKGKIVEFRRLAYETWKMIYKPKLKSVDTLLGWNSDVIYAIHNFGQTIAAYPARLVEAELARLAGEQAPEPIKHHEPNRL